MIIQVLKKIVMEKRLDGLLHKFFLSQNIEVAYIQPENCPLQENIALLAPKASRTSGEGTPEDHSNSSTGPSQRTHLTYMFTTKSSLRFGLSETFRRSQCFSKPSNLVLLLTFFCINKEDSN
jgi:hypothetical protein